MSGTPSIPEQIETRIASFKLSSLKLLEVNARYMTPIEFASLVQNIQRDGKLTSTPVVYKGEVLSGNHRVKAAIKAGLQEADCIEILTELSPERRLAIQLSQNAINGKDDPNILAKLYTSINSIEWRSYSGLSDDAFKCSEAKLASLGITRPKYEELTIVFLPEEKEAFLQLLEKVGKAAKAKTLIAGSLADFDALFDAIVRVKQQKNVINNATALRLLAELAVQELDREKLSTENA